MSSIRPSSAASSLPGADDHGVAFAWGPMALVRASLAYLSPAMRVFMRAPDVNALIVAAMWPLTLFLIGLATMIGAALAIWPSCQPLSPAERRSRMVGAATSALLFLPALLLIRFVG